MLGVTPAIQVIKRARKLLFHRQLAANLQKRKQKTYLRFLSYFRKGENAECADAGRPLSRLTTSSSTILSD